LPIEVLLGLDQDHWGGFLRAGPASAHRPAQMFTACVFEADEPFRCEALTDCIESLPSSVLRVKGIVVTDDNPGQPQTLQIVGRRWELAPVAASLRPLPARTRLVAVGLVGLDDADLRRRLTGALAP
jgi:G3E family GTPase